MIGLHPRRFRSRASRRRSCTLPRRRSPESGYALIMVMLLALSFLISSQILIKQWATEGRRQREARMIWAGEQYERAIRLYYRKAGHYPQSLDDLKTGLPGLHFLRIEAYNNPMNSDDGSWRLIYVNSTGQIIGSVRYATLQQMAYMEMNKGNPLAQGALLGQSNVKAFYSSYQGASSSSWGSNGEDDGCGPPSITPPPQIENQNAQNASQADQNWGENPSGTSASAASPSSPSAQSSSGQQTNQTIAGQLAGAMGMTGGPSAAAAPGAYGQAASTPGVGLLPNGQPGNPFAGLQPTGPVNDQVVGGWLTGVAGKYDDQVEDKCSVKIVDGGRKYKDWEFIWNPVLDQARGVQQGLSGITQQPGVAGAPTPSGNVGTGGPGGSMPSPGQPPQQSPYAPPQPQQ